MNGLLSVREAAQTLSCSEAMLRKWLYQDKIPCVKVGRLVRIRLDDLNTWIRLGLTEGAEKAKNQAVG